MRKRSSVAQEELPLASSPHAPPEPELKVRATLDMPKGTWVDDNVFYFACPDCGLIQSASTAKRNDEGLWHCFRCKALLDPDEEITPEFVEKCEQHKTLGTPVKPKPAPAVEAKAPPKQSIPQPNVDNHPKCKECGTRLTETKLGLFCPQGHPQPKPGAAQPPPAKSPAPPAKEPEPKSSEPVAKAPPAAKSVSLPAVLSSTEAVETVHVVWGKETFSPKRDNWFANGEFSVTIALNAGETHEQAMERGWAMLERFAKVTFEKKFASFISRLEQVAEKVG